MSLCIQLIIPFNDPPRLSLAEARNKLEDRKGGFPHSEITGSKGARASPVLIAACHVLHRLSTPRHPSEALLRLIVLSKTHALVASPTGKKCRSAHAWTLIFCQTMSSRARPQKHDCPVEPSLYNFNATREQSRRRKPYFLNR